MSVFRELSPTQKKSLEFLKRELSDGSKKEVRQLQIKAQSLRIPPRSLTFSRKMLGIKVTRDGQIGGYFWRLPNKK